MYMDKFFQCKITITVTEEWNVSWADEFAGHEVNRDGNRQDLSQPGQRFTDDSDRISVVVAVDAAGNDVPHQQEVSLHTGASIPQLLILQRLPHGLGWRVLTEAEARTVSLQAAE